MEYFIKWFNETLTILTSRGFTQSDIDSFPYWKDSFCYEMTSSEAVVDFEQWLIEKA